MFDGKYPSLQTIGGSVIILKCNQLKIVTTFDRLVQKQRCRLVTGSLTEPTIYG